MTIEMYKKGFHSTIKEPAARLGKNKIHFNMAAMEKYLAGYHYADLGYDRDTGQIIMKLLIKKGPDSLCFNLTRKTKGMSFSSTGLVKHFRLESQTGYRYSIEEKKLPALGLVLILTPGEKINRKPSTKKTDANISPVGRKPLVSNLMRETVEDLHSATMTGAFMCHGCGYSHPNWKYAFKAEHPQKCIKCGGTKFERTASPRKRIPEATAV